MFPLPSWLRQCLWRADFQATQLTARLGAAQAAFARLPGGDRRVARARAAAALRVELDAIASGYSEMEWAAADDAAAIVAGRAAADNAGAQQQRAAIAPPTGAPCHWAAGTREPPAGVASAHWAEAQVRQCLCLEFPLPPWLRQCLCLRGQDSAFALCFRCLRG